jgi:hypothetical protein
LRRSARARCGCAARRPHPARRARRSKNAELGIFSGLNSVSIRTRTRGGTLGIRLHRHRRHDQSGRADAGARRARDDRGHRAHSPPGPELLHVCVARPRTSQRAPAARRRIPADRARTGPHPYASRSARHSSVRPLAPDRSSWSGARPASASPDSSTSSSKSCPGLRC